jgi:hypothetical protein
MTASSRRKLLQTGAFAGVAALVPLGRTEARPARSGAPADSAAQQYFWPTRSAFSAHLGSTFVTGARVRPVRLQLAEVTDLPSAALTGSAGYEETFAVRFHGPAGLPLSQGTHALQHPAFGTLSIFIVPIGPPARIRVYEAIFNQRPA